MRSLIAVSVKKRKRPGAACSLSFCVTDPMTSAAEAPPSYLPGILAMLLGQFCFSVNDALVKWLVSQQPQADSIFWVLFLRGLMVCAFALGWLLVRKEGRVRHFWPPNLLHGRGLIEVALTSFFFASVLLLPLSDVYTIMLSAPLMITAAGAFFLKERVDLRT